MCTAHLRPLQSVVNTAAQLITRKQKFYRINSTLYDLHWLPVRQSIEHKLCSLVSKCLRHTATPYLADMCIYVSSIAGHHLCSVARTWLVQYGSRSFAILGLVTWKALPVTMRDLIQTTAMFHSKLNAKLFTRAYPHWHPRDRFSNKRGRT